MCSESVYYYDQVACISNKAHIIRKERKTGKNSYKNRQLQYFGNELGIGISAYLLTSFYNYFFQLTYSVELLVMPVTILDQLVTTVITEN